MELLPFSNIAVRCAVASAVAGAAASGMVAVMVSRFGSIVGATGTVSRVVCGAVAGLGFAFSGSFWGKAVVADSWPLTMALFALTLLCLSFWFFEESRRRWLYLAAFVYGISLSESQAVMPAGYALPFLLACRDPALGRDMMFVLSVVLWAAAYFGGFYVRSVLPVVVAAAMVSTVVWAALVFVTRKVFDQWKSVMICAGLFLFGLAAIFLLPIYSMTNPPVNWGYPRIEDGFGHLMSRGQYDSFSPAKGLGELTRGWMAYWENAVSDLGLLYIAAALAGVFLVNKGSGRGRGWVLGLGLVWFWITLLALVALNVGVGNLEAAKVFFGPSHLILAILAGFGLILLAQRGDRKKFGECVD